MSPSDVAAEVSDRDFELAVGVDQLQSTIVGGLRKNSVMTGAVIGGIEEAQLLLAEFGSIITAPQLAALHLLSALRSA